MTVGKSTPPGVWRVPRGYQPPSESAWEAIRQRDIWLPDRSTPDGYYPTPSEILDTVRRPADHWTPPPLGNNVITATPPHLEAVREARLAAEREAGAVRLDATRRLRYSLRHTAQDYSENANASKCGRCRYESWRGGKGAVGVVVSADRGAHFTGLIKCGSVWACPVCMYRICSERAEEVRTVVQRHRATGGGVYMLTLTLPHDAVDDLKKLRQRVAWAWSKVQAGAAYKRLKERVGVVGTIRALEVTTGPSGWHPHLHVLVLTKEQLQERRNGKLDRNGELYKITVYRRWQRYVTRRDLDTWKAYRGPTWEHGITFVASHKDEYITKLGLADELTRGSWKRSRELAGYRTPLQILRDITTATQAKREPRSRDVALWTEYVKEMHGARQLTWSRDLRELYDLGEEQTDLQLAEKEDDDPGVEVYSIEPHIWDMYFRNNWVARCELLKGAELSGWDGVQAVIDRLRGLQPLPF